MTAIDVIRRADGADSATDSPVSKRSRVSLNLIVFLFIFVAPVMAAAGYFGLIASDRYVSEVQFLVRSQSQPQMTGLSMFLRTIGLSRSDDDSAAVEAYIGSREALEDLSERLPIAMMLDHPDADFLARCSKPWAIDSFEHLYRCYQRRIHIVRYSDSGITRLSVDLFRPEDARAVALELIRSGEALANQINLRAEQDAVDRMDRLLASAEQRLLASQSELTEFRRENQFIDIEGAATPIGASMTSIAEQMVATRVEIEELRQSAPNNPRISSLVTRLSILEDQMREQEQELAGGANALSNQIAAYETLVLRQNLAEKSVELASEAMDNAIEELNRQLIYVERVSGPNSPDASIRPRRIRGVATTAIVALFVYGMVWLLVVGSREHLNQA